MTLLSALLYDYIKSPDEFGGLVAGEAALKCDLPGTFASFQEKIIYAINIGRHYGP